MLIHNLTNKYKQYQNSFSYLIISLFRISYQDIINILGTCIAIKQKSETENLKTENTENESILVVVNTVLYGFGIQMSREKN